MADIDYGNMGVWEYEPFISYVHSAPLKQQNILHSTFSPRKTSIALHGVMIKWDWGGGRDTTQHQGSIGVSELLNSFGGSHDELAL